MEEKLTYGIASRSMPEVEDLGPLRRDTAESILADSRATWPDVYLVARVDGGEWAEVHRCAGV